METLTKAEAIARLDVVERELVRVLALVSQIRLDLRDDDTLD